MMTLSLNSLNLDVKLCIAVQAYRDISFCGLNNKIQSGLFLLISCFTSLSKINSSIYLLLMIAGIHILHHYVV